MLVNDLGLGIKGEHLEVLKHLVNKVSAVVKHLYYASFPPVLSQAFVLGLQHIPKLTYFCTESLYNVFV